MNKKGNTSNKENKPLPVREVEAIRLSSDGAGVGYIDGKATFIPGMLPAEKGLVRIVEERSNYQRAEVIELSTSSLERLEPRCRIYNQCGGCDLQHFNYEYTLNWKRKWVEDALNRIGGLQNVEVRPVIGMEEPWRYRNKAVLHRDKEGRLGYYRPKTHDVAQFEDCLLLSKETNKRIERIQDVMGKAFPDIYSVIFRESNGGKGLIIFESNTKDAKSAKELEHKINELKKEEIFSPSVCSLVISKGNKEIEGSGPQYLNEYIDDTRFRVSPRAFLQVNPKQTEKLYALILEYAELKGKEGVWDLYCGIGTITLMLAKRARKVVGIEENPSAVEDAIENAKDNEINNVSFVQGRVEEKLKSLSGYPEIVVTDPPRAGMDPLVVEGLLKVKPQKIIYVSCNPATLARDLKALGCSDEGCAGSYRIEKVQPVDMFPWSGHVETIVLIERK